ncbi:hypothetical protein M885DRAFT_626841 [Pelagophyceae sp. CCMP2097]|nr:hypothetical protein M885DRAFT_626841 [Pelagophyceae sp. CCMP2097]
MRRTLRLLKTRDQQQAAARVLDGKISKALRGTRTNLALLRSGRAAPAVARADDFGRQLTDEGRAQARAAAAKFGDSLRPFHDFAIVSPAPRAIETAELFLADAVPGHAIEVERVKLVYDGCFTDAGKAAFDRLGHAPLIDYLTEETLDGGKRHLVEYAEDVATCVVQFLEGADRAPAHDRTLLIVAHAAYLPALAILIAEALDAKLEDLPTILDCNTEEAEGYLVSHDGTLVRLEREDKEMVEDFEKYLLLLEGLHENLTEEEKEKAAAEGRAGNVDAPPQLTFPGTAAPKQRRAAPKPRHAAPPELDFPGVAAPATGRRGAPPQLSFPGASAPAPGRRGAPRDKKPPAKTRPRDD